jgi:hypothetical protein
VKRHSASVAERTRHSNEHTLRTFRIHAHAVLASLPLMNVRMNGTPGIAALAIGAAVSVVTIVSSSAGFFALPIGLLVLAFIVVRRSRRNDGRDTITWNLFTFGIVGAALMTAGVGVAHQYQTTPSVVSGVAGIASSFALICFALAGGRVARPLLAARIVAGPTFVALAAYVLIVIGWQWSDFSTTRAGARVVVQALLLTGSAGLIVASALGAEGLAAIRRPTERWIALAAMIYGAVSEVTGDRIHPEHAGVRPGRVRRYDALDGARRSAVDEHL